MNQVGIIPLIPKITKEHNHFIDANVWHQLMHKRLGRMKEMMAAEDRIDEEYNL